MAGWGRGIGNTALTYRAPAGVALAITPFNAPANLLAHKLGASFAAGNTTIVKAPPQAPAVSAAVVALLLEAGAPAEAVQLLHGGGEVGAALCAADRGRRDQLHRQRRDRAAVARAAGAKRLVLELGGNAATIVCEDADVAGRRGVRPHRLQQLGPELHLGAAGLRAPLSVRRFLDAFTAEVAALKVGDPLDPDTDVGSMVDDAAAERVVVLGRRGRRGRRRHHDRRRP